MALVFDPSMPLTTRQPVLDHITDFHDYSFAKLGAPTGPDIHFNYVPATYSFDGCQVSKPAAVVDIDSTTEQGWKNGIAFLVWHLGLRWWGPGPNWQTGPTLATWDLTVTLNFEPDVHTRSWSLTYGHTRAATEPWGADLEVEQRRWWIGNYCHYAPFGEYAAGHDWSEGVEEYRAEFDDPANLDWRQLDDQGAIWKDGVINPANYDAVNRIAQNRIDKWDNERTERANYVGIQVGPPDAPMYDPVRVDQTPTGMTNASPSDTLYHAVNEICAQGTTHNALFRGTVYGYSNYNDPPEQSAASPNYTPTVQGEVHPAVLIYMSTAFLGGKKTIEQSIADWRTRLPRSNCGLREFLSVLVHNWGRWGIDRAARRKFVDDTLTRLMQSVDLFATEHTANWGCNNPGHYLSAQALVDLELDTQAVWDEWINASFQGAETEMDQFFLEVEKKPTFDPGIYYPLMEILQSAYDKAANQGAEDRIADICAHMVALAYDWERRAYEQGNGGVLDDPYWDNFCGPELNFMWRIELRNITHRYGFARQLANTAALDAGRTDMWVFEDSVDQGGTNTWKTGSQLTNAEIRTELDTFHADWSSRLYPYDWQGDLVQIPTSLPDPTGRRELQIRRATCVWFPSDQTLGDWTVEVDINATLMTLTFELYETGDFVDEQTFFYTSPGDEQVVDIPDSQEPLRVIFSAGDCYFRYDVAEWMCWYMTRQTPFECFGWTTNHPLWHYSPRNNSRNLADVMIGQTRLALKLADDTVFDVSTSTRIPGESWTDVLRQSQWMSVHHTTRSRCVIENGHLCADQSRLILPSELAVNDYLIPGPIGRKVIAFAG